MVNSFWGPTVLDWWMVPKTTGPLNPGLDAQVHEAGQTLALKTLTSLGLVSASLSFMNMGIAQTKFLPHSIMPVLI